MGNTSAKPSEDNKTTAAAVGTGDPQNQHSSNYPKDKSNLPIPKEVVELVDEYSGGAPGYASASGRQLKFSKTRVETITKNLLLAVAYGMESKDANTLVKASNAGKLFKSHLYAKDLLQASPDFLLKRGDVKDWAGRTFKNITVFEYALWAKDFKMMEMMLGCIPATPEGDKIRAELLKQANQIEAPVYAGGGLTYTHIYDCPNLDASGIPDGTSTQVKESHTENHFNLNPLCDAYDDYDTNYNARSDQQCVAYWTKLIGTLQRLLPVHILQRYCDPDTAFYRLPKFTSAFRRSSDFNNDITGVSDSSLFNSSLSSDFAIGRCGLRSGAVALRKVRVSFDLAAIRRLDEVSTNEVQNIIGQLSQPQHDAGMRP